MTHIDLGLAVVEAAVRRRPARSGPASTGEIVLFVVLIAGALAAAVFAVRRNDRMRRQLAPWKGVGSWSPAPPDSGLLHRFTGEPFRFGHWYQAFDETRNHRVQTALRGHHRGCGAVAFQYSYEHESRDREGRRRVTHHHYTIVSIDLPAHRPNLTVSRHGLVHLPGQGLQLESDQFNRTFHVRTDNEKFGYDVLHPRTMEWLLADPRAAYFPIKFDGATLSTWREGKLDRAMLGPMADFLVELLGRVPHFVWQG